MKKHLVLSARLNEELLRESPHSYLRYLPESLRQDVLKYKRKHKQWLSLIGKLLLVEGLNFLEQRTLVQHPLLYTKNNRPYLDHKLDFNISHSSQRVICVIAPDGKVGIDLQEKGNYKIAETARLFFNEPTQNKIKAGKLNLVELWCRTEAFSKAIGTGLNEDLKKYSVLEASTVHGKNQWQFWKIPVDPAFECSLVTNELHPQIEFHKYKIRLDITKKESC